MMKMSKKPRPIAKWWLKKKYWEEQLTDEEIAAHRRCSVFFVQKYIKLYDLQKAKNGIKLKGKKDYVMPESEKAKHRNQKYAKPILVFSGEKRKRLIDDFSSITAACTALDLRRDRVRMCLDPSNNRNTHRGYSFEYKRYKGEIIIERRENPDFTNGIDNAYDGLPEYPYEDRINHYNRKLALAWENLEIKKDNK
jgi:hypothetical protein